MLRVESLNSEQLIELTHAAHELSSSLQKTKVINLLLARGAELSGCKGTCLVLFNETFGSAPEVYPHGLSDGFAKDVPHFSVDLRSEAFPPEGFKHFDHLPGCCEEGICSASCFPLHHQGKRLGLLYFFHFDESSLPDSRIQILKFFADYAATAIENSLLYEDKDRKIRQLNILNESTISLSSESDTSSLYQKLTDHARILLRAEQAVLILLHRRSNRIEKIYLSGDLDAKTLRFPSQITGLFADLMTTQKTLNLREEELETHVIDLPVSLPHVTSLLAVPLIHQETSIGILYLVNKAKIPFILEDEDLLLTYGFQAALSIENARLHEHTRKLAITDGLTGIFNHREFQDRLAAEIRRCIRYKRNFALLMIDIDNFKVFNDTYGHPTGDKVLKEVARTIQESVRDIDVPARYGGEEFSVILPETTYEHALVVAERIRGKIFEKSFGRTLNNEDFSITVSLGIASFPEDALNREELIQKCDQALYFAKREGRNRTRRYDETLKAFIEKKENHIEDILKDAKIKVMRDLAAAVDAKNLFTRGHTDEVVHYSVGLAKALKFPPEEIESIRLAGILHDIGTVSIPEEILNKPGPLTEEEERIIRGHPELGELILQKVNELEKIIPAIRYHHERYDGTGYPNGLKGNDIPLMARMLGLVEAYQAMTSDRPYRQRFSKSAAIAELKQNAGTQFDPELVKIFVELVS